MDPLSLEGQRQQRKDKAERMQSVLAGMSMPPMLPSCFKVPDDEVCYLNACSGMQSLHGVVRFDVLPPLPAQVRALCRLL